MNFFRRILFPVLILLSFAVKMEAQEYKPVTGTWLNLVWQDERNNYMNPHYMDNTDPQRWRTKVDELHELGVDCLIIMQVANEQKAFYPSSFMEKAYPEDRESPVEAIVAEADKNGMQVFLSCGWAKNQLDDQRKPEVKAVQMKIMEELVALFKDHPSFYGWYLPVEDSFNPYLSDEAIVAANAITHRAKELTPGKKVMISPWGLYRSNVDEPIFGEQIAKLDVDIIAYQDEIGCVRIPCPMKEMKEHFAALRAIHDKAGIELWANIEAFTWDRGTNTWYSSLIPAASGRYLSQIVGVNQAGVDKVVSFAISGIMDKPYSNYPLGQPVEAAKAYTNYKNWLDGRGRWPMLAASFAGKLENSAVGGKTAHEALTDGRLGYEDPSAAAWTRFDEGKMEVVVDLGRKQEIDRLAVRFLNYRIANVAIPPMVDFYVSDNGKHFDKMETVVMDVSPNDLHDCWIDMARTHRLKVKARYVKVVAVSSPHVYGGKEMPAILCDEIFVNPVVLN